MRAKRTLLVEGLSSQDRNDEGQTMEELMQETGLSQMTIIRRLQGFRAAGRLKTGQRTETDARGRRTHKPVYLLLEKPEG